MDPHCSGHESVAWDYGVYKTVHLQGFVRYLGICHFIDIHCRAQVLPEACRRGIGVNPAVVAYVGSLSKW